MSKTCLFLFLASWQFTVQAQRIITPSVVAYDQITVESTPAKTIISSSGSEVRRYAGNVKLRQQTTLLFCDRAVHQLATNIVNAAGHVLLVQNDSITVKSDSLVYDGATQEAILTGHVLLQNGRSVLTATQLTYNLRTGTAQYSGKGRLANGRIIQTVLDGAYDIHTKQLAVNQANKPQPRSHVPEPVAVVHSAPAQVTTQLQDDPRPVQLTMAPQLNNIVTKPESVGTYKKPNRVSQRALQTATVSSEQASNESDLEHLLNQKKRFF